MKPWKRAWHGTKEDAKLYKIWSANTVWMAFFPFRSHTSRGGFIPHIPHILPFICNMVWLAGCPCYCYIEDEDRVDCWSNIQFFFLLFAVLCLTCIFGRLLRKLVHYSTWFWEVFFFIFCFFIWQDPYAHKSRHDELILEEDHSFSSTLLFNSICVVFFFFNYYFFSYMDSVLLLLLFAVLLFICMTH